jgi:hypothetical protein
MVMSDGPVMFDCEAASLFLYDESKNTLWTKYFSGPFKKLIEIPVSFKNVKTHVRFSWKNC